MGVRRRGCTRTVGITRWANREQRGCETYGRAVPVRAAVYFLGGVGVGDLGNQVSQPRSVCDIRRIDRCDSCVSDCGPRAPPNPQRFSDFLKPASNSVCFSTIVSEQIRESRATKEVQFKRLKELLLVLIESMERHAHLPLDPVMRSALLDISVSTIDVMGSFLF